VYITGLLLSVLGTILMLSLMYLLTRLRRAKLYSDEENKRKSTFLARMSHELRTPLNTIIGTDELILVEDLNGRVKGYAASIKQAAFNLLAIINEILEFSKIESGRLVIDPFPLKYGVAAKVSGISPTSPARPEVARHEQEKSPASTTQNARVLIVDVLETNLHIAKSLLSRYQMEVTLCRSGKEAVELVKHNSYDLVLMDYMMPEMDGIEATTAIRKWEQSERKDREEEPPKAVPIIAFTANTVSGLKEMFLEKGFNDFLSKPIDIARLDEVIARWVSREKQAAE
jgi:CheY-like chemotaxis protein